MFLIICLGSALLCAIIWIVLSNKLSIRLPDTLLIRALLLVFCMASLLFLIELSSVLEISWQETSWPSVEGRVTAARISGKRAFHPQISYQYRVSGHQFSGKTDLDIAGFGGRRSRQQTADRIIRDFTPGKKIKVFYDPSQPDRSKLRVGILWSDFVKLALFFLLFVFTFASILGMFYQGLYKKNH